MPGRSDTCCCGSGKKFKHCCEKRVVSNTLMPSHPEIIMLISLYDSGRFVELENRARLRVSEYPAFGFGWKLLGGALQMQGKNALAAFQRATELMPGEADSHYNLGVAQSGLGLLHDAESSYRLALKIKPDFDAARGNLGNVLKAQGRLDEALECFRKATDITPNSAVAHSDLGAFLCHLGHHEDALVSYRRAVELKPDSAELHYYLRKTLCELGRFDEALSCYQKAAENKLGFAMTHYNLGNLLREYGQQEYAVESYRRSLEINPGFADAYVNLGVVLQRLDRLTGAETCYRKALEIKPDSAEAYSNLGHVLRQLWRFNEAMECYRHAMRIDCNFIEAMLGAALLHMEDGETAEAETLLEKAVKISPGNLEARYLLAQAKKVKIDDENFAALRAIDEAARNTNPVPDKEAIYLHFALGKCFDEVGEYDLACQHYLKGCQLKRANLAYDAKQSTRYFKDIMRSFDQSAIDRLRGGGDLSRAPIFVLGMPRSGTTLTEQIIAAHPDVCGAGELPDLLAVVNSGSRNIGGRFPEDMSLVGQDDLTAWAHEYVIGLRKRAPNSKRVVDKMPMNFLAVGLIHLMLPNAKIIHVNRNPIDTCFSCLTKLFNSKLEHTYDLVEMGLYYNDYVRLMGHWRSVLPAGAFLDVQYENLVVDQEMQARRMIDFCELDWDDACIDFYKGKHSIRTSSLTQARQPMYTSSVNRWQRYEKHLGPLIEVLTESARDIGRS